MNSGYKRLFKKIYIYILKIYSMSINRVSVCDIPLEFFKNKNPSRKITKPYLPTDNPSIEKHRIRESSRYTWKQTHSHLYKLYSTRSIYFRARNQSNNYIYTYICPSTCTSYSIQSDARRLKTRESSRHPRRIYFYPGIFVFLGG